jgi:hypothetical protein
MTVKQLIKELQDMDVEAVISVVANGVYAGTVVNIKVEAPDEEWHGTVILEAN